MAKKQERRFDPVSSEYLVPFDGEFSVKSAETKPPKKSRDDAENEEVLASSIAKLRKLQARLAAADRDSFLVVFQAMDAAGKDGTLRAVMTGVNPAGVDVHSFKAPNDEELDHDFLWRVHRRVPERGRIGIFNRSHYEEVLAVRVHPEHLERQRLPHVPKKLDALWDERYQSIRDFEQHLARNGTTILKLWLNVSKDEQKKRFLARVAEPDSNWKFNAGDIHARASWDAYMKAYERALNETSRPWAPWYAIPADDKKFMRRTVADILVRTLERIDPQFPEATEEARAEMLEAAEALASE
ncbi:MAG: polyphosphate kinase 2 family protein [Myxococcota bacterium]|nr:polyphosphate kinase 2 family protein [Myxococcota bacterium]